MWVYVCVHLWVPSYNIHIYIYMKVLKQRNNLSFCFHCQLAPSCFTTLIKTKSTLWCNLITASGFQLQLWTLPQRSLFERYSHIKKILMHAERFVLGLYVVYGSILTPGPFILGVDTSFNAETVNHWARETAVTLPIHAIKEIAELMKNIQSTYYTFCKLCFFFYLWVCCIIPSNAITLYQDWALLFTYLFIFREVSLV